MTPEKFEMNGKLSTRVQSHLYDNTKYTKIYFNFCLFPSVKRAFKLLTEEHRLSARFAHFRAVNMKPARLWSAVVLH